MFFPSAGIFFHHIDALSGRVRTVICDEGRGGTAANEGCRPCAVEVHRRDGVARSLRARAADSPQSWDRKTAINQNGLAGYETRVLRGEPENRLRDILGPSKTL